MKLLKSAIVTMFFGLVSYCSYAEKPDKASNELPQLNVTVLQAGTVNWELEHLKKQGYDKQHGFVLNLRKVASLPAARLALTSKSTDIIVSDWLWAGKRNQANDSLRFIPFSNQIGVALKAKTLNAESIINIDDLRGKRIGVAGSPLNKGWVLMQSAAKQKGINLKQENSLQFGSPPLLNQALKRGQIDLLVTFWHFGARLKVEGFETLLSLEDLMIELGMKSRVPMLGYIFHASLAENHPSAVKGFQKAIQLTKQDLMQHDASWADLAPLMKAESAEIQAALIAGYRQGTPSAMTDQQIEDAAQFFKLIEQLKTHPSNEQLDISLFYRPDNSTDHSGSRK